MLYQIICIALYNADHTNLFQKLSTTIELGLECRNSPSLLIPALHSTLKFE